jgi:alginate production protein
LLRSLLALLPLLAAVAPAQEEVPLGVLREGHWVVLSGELSGLDAFLVEEVELTQPDDEESLVGVIENLREVKAGYEFLVLGQPVTTDARTDLPDGPPVEGQLVRVEGHYEGPQDFQARQLRFRKGGRARIEGRIDSLRAQDDGLSLRVQRFRVFIPSKEGVELEEELDAIRLAPRSRHKAQPIRMRDEDRIPGREVAPDLFLGLRAETNFRREDDFNLSESDDEDREDFDASLRAEVTWAPPGRFTAVASGRLFWRDRMDEQDGDSIQRDARLVEAFGYWDRLPWGTTLQVGRQDFEEPREWLWDQELDAARLGWSEGPHSLQLAAMTTWSNGNAVDRNSANLMASYTWTDSDRTLGAYILDRRIDLGYEDLGSNGKGFRGYDYPLFMGVRALGEWLPDTDCWLELAHVTGYTDGADVDLQADGGPTETRRAENLRAWGLDLGTVWEPKALEPFHFAIGLAYGAGDDQPGDGVNRTFRQTGYHDNNDDLGGATSVKYYGELLEPDLSNLAIRTLSVGATLSKRTSIDLIYHDYRQPVPDAVRVGELSDRADGVSDDLGWELDLVYGNRANPALDIEVAFCHFEPGEAFRGADPAQLLRVQLRIKF